jgi:hypothetical protein
MTDREGEDAYADRAELQEKGDLYLEALVSISAEYKFGLTGDRSALDDFDAVAADSKKSQWSATDGSRRRRGTKGEKKKKGSDQLDRIPTLEEGDTPGDLLKYELLKERIDAKGGNEVIPIRHTIKELRAIADSASSNIELTIVSNELTRLRSMVRTSLSIVFSN